jgi:hypothetical protein
MGIGRPFATVAEFQAALDAMRERPMEVRRPRRGVQLLLTAPLLALGLLWMYLTPLVFVYGRFVERFVLGAQGEVVVQQYSRLALPRRVAALAACPDNWGRLVAAGQLGADQAELRLLRERLARGEQERDLVLQSSTWVTRYLLDRLRAGVKKAAQTPRPADSPLIGLDHPDVAGVRQMLELTDELFAIDPAEYVWAWAALALWPALWTVWAFVTRGGVVRRLVGVRLVQGDGRPAARWRCAWRALALWLPPVALLWLATALDLEHIQRDYAAGGVPGTSWSALLSWLCWWLALVLLPLYVWLAQRSPARALHDRVAGTYLVPR